MRLKYLNDIPLRCPFFIVKQLFILFISSFIFSLYPLYNLKTITVIIEMQPKAKDPPPKEKGPMHPNQLFQKLLQSNFKESECIDEAARIKEEKKILYSLINEYKREISVRVMQAEENERLLQRKAKLRAELEQLRADRFSIDRSFADEAGMLKSPIEIREEVGWLSELQEVRDKNCRLSIRVKELSEYLLKMENYNVALEKERKIVNSKRVRSQVAIENDWRQRIRLMRRQQELYTQDIRTKIKAKELEALQRVHLEEQELIERRRTRDSLLWDRFRR